jgi:hypothetical protein
LDILLFTMRWIVPVAGLFLTTYTRWLNDYDSLCLSLPIYAPERIDTLTLGLWESVPMLGHWMIAMTAIQLITSYHHGPFCNFLVNLRPVSAYPTMQSL